VQKVLDSILINKRVRLYYGKKYHRQTSISAGGGTQKRLFANQARANKIRISQGTVRTEPSEETEIIFFV
jgi:hypothetical protein